MSTDTVNTNYTSPVNNNYSSFLYHFINESNGVPIYPYITAITGHRRFTKSVPQQSDQEKQTGQDEQLAQGDQPVQSKQSHVFSEKEIKEAFKSQLKPMAELWRKSCGKGTAPFVLLTGMADGSDQIAAEAALELVERDPELNIKVVAVLPMPEHLFINTVEDRDRYNALMEKVSYKFALKLTKDNQNHESEMVGDSDEAELRRQRQYAKLSLFLAVHSHVLFAFWDGVPSTQLKGGTADTVFLKLNGITDIPYSQVSETPNQGDLLTFSSVGPVIHLLTPRDNDDNRAFGLDNSQDMSSIPILYWTKDKKRKLENTIKEQEKKKAKEQAQNQSVSDANSETDQDKHSLELKYSQWFDNCDPLVSISKLDFRNNLMNSDLLCKSAIADQKEIKEVLVKMGALNLFSVNQFNRNAFIDKCRPKDYKFDSFFQKCKNESNNWLFEIYVNQDDQSSENASKDEVSFSDLLGELRPWEDKDTRMLVEHYVLADQIAMKYQKYSGIIADSYSKIFAALFLVTGILATFWSIRIYGWAQQPQSYFHFVWTYFGTENPYALWCLPISSWAYIILSVFLIALYIAAKCLKYHYRYHRFRAVAEALRIQIFWRIAGMNDCVSGYYRSHQIPETEWIRAAVNGLDVFLPEPKETAPGEPKETDSGDSPVNRIHFVKDTWILGQRNYFISGRNKRINNLKKANFFTHPAMLVGLAILFFGLQLKGDIIRFFYSPSLNQSNLAITIFVVIGIVLSFITGLVVKYTMELKFKRYKAEAKRFEQVLFPFDRALLLLNSLENDAKQHVVNEETIINKQQMILRQLGSEAISENINWLLTVGEQDLTLPR